MAIFAKAKTTTPPIPAGTFTATCISVYDLGLQYNENYGNTSYKVQLTWEAYLPGEEKARLASKEYTLSLNEKSGLYKDMMSWRAHGFTPEEMDTGFDVKAMLGKSCLLGIIHNEKGYHKIASVMSLPVGMNPPARQNELSTFAFSSPDWLDKLPGWIKDKIKRSDTYQDKLESADVGTQVEKEADDLGLEDVEFPY